MRKLILKQVAQASAFYNIDYVQMLQVANAQKIAIWGLFREALKKAWLCSIEAEMHFEIDLAPA